MRRVYYYPGRMTNFLKQTLVIVAIFFATLAIMPERANAFAYPCGAGPGPGEVQVGVMGGSHGIAATPMCEAASSGSGSGSGSVPKSAAQVMNHPVDNYFAIVTHPGVDDVWATAGQYRKEGAEMAVLEPCRITMGSGCVILASGRNAWVAVARGKDGAFRYATDADPKRAKKALNAQCKSAGANCKDIRLFDSRVRYSDIVSEQFLSADFDREGFFKAYHFPASSKVPPPRRGTPDAGWIAGANILSRLPEIPGIRKVHFSAAGSWLLRNGDSKGLGCSLTYVNADQRVLFVGPTANDKRGALMISSKLVPTTASPRETQVSMSGDRGTVNVRVFHMPSGQAGEAGFILMPTDLPATIASISDSSPLTISLDGTKVVDMLIEGGNKAKSAMQQCMAKR